MSGRDFPLLSDVGEFDESRGDLLRVCLKLLQGRSWAHHEIDVAPYGLRSGVRLFRDDLPVSLIVARVNLRQLIVIPVPWITLGVTG